MIKSDYKAITVDLLNHSPEAGGLLIQLHDKHKLYNFSNKSDHKTRCEVTGIMAQLLQLDLTGAQVQLITEVLLGFIKQAETDLRRAVAERLSSLDNVPLKLINHLANDEIIVADPILRYSPLLEKDELHYIIESQQAGHWQAIASRSYMDDEIIDTLADKKDIDTALGLVKNKNITLTVHSMQIFSGLTKTSEKLVKPLLSRKELPKKMAKKLYRQVGEDIKEYIAENFSFEDAKIATDVVDDIVFETVSDVEINISPSAKMIEEAENMYQRGFLTVDVMIKKLRNNQFVNFVAMFAVYCNLPVETVCKVLKQESAQGLAVACKAVNLTKPDFMNIYLLTATLRGHRIIGNTQLARSMKYFDKITSGLAVDIMNESRH